MTTNAPHAPVCLEQVHKRHTCIYVVYCVEVGFGNSSVYNSLYNNKYVRVQRSKVIELYDVMTAIYMHNECTLALFIYTT